MSNAELIAAAEGLSAEVIKLSETVKKQTEVIDRLDTRGNKNIQKIRLITGALALTVGVVLFNGYLIREIRSTQQQTSEVLCPLYSIFLANDTPEAEQDLTEKQREYRQEAFQVIREGMVRLGCA